MIESDSENLIVYTKSGAMKLEGDDGSWRFRNAASNLGSQRHGVQKLDDIFSFSRRGIGALRRSDTTGGYTGGTVSQNIQTLIKSLGLTMTCSVTIPSKEQVRWYFSNNTWLMMTHIPTAEGSYYSFSQGFDPNTTVRGACTEVWSDGTERTFLVSDDGYVYESEVGSNFNGEVIYSFLGMHSNHLKTPARDKSFKRVFFEGKSSSPVTLTLSYNINYGLKEFATKDVTIAGGEDVYNEALYDEARFDVADRTRSRATLKGKGFTIGFTLDHESKFALPFKVTGYTVVYSILGKAKK